MENKMNNREILEHKFLANALDAYNTRHNPTAPVESWDRNFRAYLATILMNEVSDESLKSWTHFWEKVNA
jgi:hypothetical protein